MKNKFLNWFKSLVSLPDKASKQTDIENIMAVSKGSRATAVSVKQHEQTLSQAVEEAIRSGTSLTYAGRVSQVEIDTLKKKYPQLSIFQNARSGEVAYTEEEERTLSISGCDFVAIDFETANANRNSACSIGMIHVKDGLIRQRVYQTIKPPTLDFNPINVRKHGIKASQVQDSPTFDQVWQNIQSRFDGQLIIAHNAASFDISVLKACAQHYQIELGDLKYGCTMKAAEKLGWPKKLNLLCKQLTIDLEHHNALSDAEACAKIVIHLYRTGQETALLSQSMNSSASNWTAPSSEEYFDWHSRREDWHKKAIQAQIDQIESTHAIPDSSKSLAELKLELNKIRSGISKLKRKITDQPDHPKQLIWHAQLKHLSAMKTNFEKVLNNLQHGE